MDSLIPSAVHGEAANSRLCSALHGMCDAWQAKQALHKGEGVYHKRPDVACSGRPAHNHSPWMANFMVST